MYVAKYLDDDPTSHQDAIRTESPFPNTPKEDVQLGTSGQVSPRTDQNSTISSIASTKSISTVSPPSVGSKAIVIGSFSERLKKLQEKRTSKSTSPTSLTFLKTNKVSEDTPYATQRSSPSQLTSSFGAAPITSSTSITDDSRSGIKPLAISSNQAVNNSSFSYDKSSHLTANEHQKSSSSVSTVPLKAASNEEPLDEDKSALREVTNLPVGDGVEDDQESEVESEDDDLPPTPPPPIPDLLPSDESESELGQEEVVPTTQRSATVTSKVSFRTLQRKDDWNRKSEQLQRDILKSNALPLLGSSSETPQLTSPAVLPNNKPIHTSTPSSQSLESPLVRKGLFSTGSTIEEHDKSPLDGASLNDSSESLPSLPDSLPPALPDAPPPALPEAPPPDIQATPTQDASFLSISSSEEVFESMQVEVIQDSLQAEVPCDLSDEYSSRSTPGSKRDSKEGTFTFNFPPESPKADIDSNPPSFLLLKHSTPIGSIEDKGSMTTNDVVQIRGKKSPDSSHSLENSVNRRSAFDALVSVEPTAQDKQEPKLSLEDRRQLALMASRGPSADVKPVLNRWSKQAPNDVKAEDELRVSSTPNILGSKDKPSTKDGGGRTTSMTGVTNVEYSSSQSTLQQTQETTLLSRNEEQLQHPSEEEVSNGKGFEPVQQLSSLHNLGDSKENDFSGQHTELNLRSSPKLVKQIRVISEGTPPSSPDLRFTRIGKENWKLSKRPPKQLVEDDLSASASTGDIMASSPSKKKQRLKKTSSLHSFSSSSESVKTGFVLPWSKSKKSSSKKSKRPTPISPLAAVTVSTQNAIPKSPTTISLHSDDSDQASSPNPTSKPLSQSAQDKQAKRKSAGLFEAMFADSPKPQSRDNFQYTRSRENLASSLPGRDLKHQDMIEQQLAKVKEQRKMTQELLRRDPLALVRSLTPRGSPRGSRPASMILGTDIYKVSYVIATLNIIDPLL